MTRPTRGPARSSATTPQLRPVDPVRALPPAPTHPGTGGVSGPTTRPLPELLDRPAPGGRSFAGPAIDCTGVGLYLCDPGDGRAVARLEPTEATELARYSPAMIRERDVRGGWSPWPVGR